MPIIAVLNPKGGSGKTTISINLAHAFQIAGYKTLLIDSDRQGSARDWNEINNGKIVPVIGFDRPTLVNDIKTVKDNYDIIIIDGAAGVTELSAPVIKVADFVLIPVTPSPYDVLAVEDLVELIKARQEVTDNKLQAAFVISREIHNTILSKEVKEALLPFGLSLLKSSTTQRQLYPRSAGQGQTVYSSVFNDCALEIDGIRNELIERLNYDIKKKKFA